MIHHRVKVSYCSKCEAKLDAATNADGSPNEPKPGDFTICAMCGTLHKFNNELLLEPANIEDAAEEDREELRRIVVQAQTIIRNLRN